MTTATPVQIPDEMEEVDSRDDADQIHVYPRFGKSHTLSINCWCCPTQDEQEARVLIHHPDN